MLQDRSSSLIRNAVSLPLPCDTCFALKEIWQMDIGRRRMRHLNFAIFLSNSNTSRHFIALPVPRRASPYAYGEIKHSGDKQHKPGYS